MCGWAGLNRIIQSPLDRDLRPPESLSTRMSHHPNSVSIHPYFQVKPGQMTAARALLPQFVARTSTEPLCLGYNFTINGEVIHCRESYIGAEGALAHLENVGALIGEMLKCTDLVRLEIHGPAAELEKMKAPLADLNPAWFAYECGVTR